MKYFSKGVDFTRFLSLNTRSILRDKSCVGISNSEETEYLENLQTILLLGPQQSGKTSLLFQYALSCATEGHEILFVCQSQEKLMDCVKVRSDLPCPSLLKNVHIRYVDDGNTLCGLLSCLHITQLRPSVIIIDDLAAYCGPLQTPESIAAAARICAYLHDALNWLRELDSSKQYELLASDNTDTAMSASNTLPLINLLQLYRRFFTWTLSLQRSQYATCVLRVENGLENDYQGNTNMILRFADGRIEMLPQDGA